MRPIPQAFNSLKSMFQSTLAVNQESSNSLIKSPPPKLVSTGSSEKNELRIPRPYRADQQ